MFTIAKWVVHEGYDFVWHGPRTLIIDPFAKNGTVAGKGNKQIPKVVDITNITALLFEILLYHQQLTLGYVICWVGEDKQQCCETFLLKISSTSSAEIVPVVAACISLFIATPLLCQNLSLFFLCIIDPNQNISTTGPVDLGKLFH